MIWTLLVLPILLLLAGVPVFAALFASALATIIFFTSLPLVAIHQVVFGAIDNFSLMAIPFFIFAGEMMSQGGISRRIIDWVMAMVGRSRAGLPLTTIGASTFFGAISGSSPATVAAIGKLVHKPLRDDGYDEAFSAGLITSSGAVAIVIPPSIAMILYGIATEQPITTLFIAGIVPGLLMALVVGAYLVIADRRSQPTGKAVERPSFLYATRRSAWALGAPVLVLGGIYLGIFSPTEAGGLASVYAILVSRFIYREVDWLGVMKVAVSAAKLTAQVMLIVAAAGLYSWLLTINGVPQATAQFLSAAVANPIVLLLMINVVFLIVGCFLDPNSAILVLAPLIAPLALAAGIDLIHLGIVMTVNLAIGMFTPPFGLNIFVAQAVLEVPARVIYRGIMPFIIINLVTLALITYVPEISLFLTRHLG